MTFVASTPSEVCAFTLQKPPITDGHRQLGPDNQQNISVDVQTKNGLAAGLDLYGAELHLRGSGEVKQPHQKNGNILCWNGEVNLFPSICLTWLRHDQIFSGLNVNYPLLIHQICAYHA